LGDTQSLFLGAQGILLGPQANLPDAQGSATRRATQRALRATRIA
jgi:hypothetical protein